MLIINCIFFGSGESPSFDHLCPKKGDFSLLELYFVFIQAKSFVFCDL